MKSLTDKINEGFFKNVGAVIIDLKRIEDILNNLRSVKITSMIKASWDGNSDKYEELDILYKEFKNAPVGTQFMQTFIDPKKDSKKTVKFTPEWAIYIKRDEDWWDVSTSNSHSATDDSYAIYYLLTWTKASGKSKLTFI